MFLILRFQIIFLCYVIWWKPVKYGKVTPYPLWAHSMGFCMSLASMMWIPGYAAYFMVTQRGSFKDVSQNLKTKPRRDDSFSFCPLSFQRLLKGITADIKSKRMDKAMRDKEMKMSESSARLLKNASFLTNNTNSFNVANP